ncbi:MAG: precorrin-6y C5,15-methyltransferase (decarboxylating) subunit CbiE [Candidatus Brocadia sp.]|jgi:precorrin-6y C5,15-methyltransferase (decarboxylating), CbiE subunit|uniref:Precorrin-6 methyltransferase CbiE n=1 Tax=Candidatus Brocadia fulgida TaxID=380242 RepID=A0A0M2UY72_9BACT|nr:MAG: precorrin-6 methyltransferase CbiE [Candidatus Brocadia fulgida]MCC6325794.1 precorrin-6y C5,15-methyltransferase (decarboxylating) subunit CbiE [Candidatus Brocadia sp.]MCE7911886.1 precorrin-6y C5,15-methyltransferase (decarboxylating) subunit CbiE [Candidatus Brocadia sp. AMX3]MDG5997649.1 precorrin-6y C5,15-methyltransferase (decarboxylating) subunit CbiE [Candidatus Brocadia sp.]RIK00392.1 MAG: precorrin-6y C5,15-methyltransferase (decarboxylating) subunit CbiE [Candidatus Brocadia
MAESHKNKVIIVGCGPGLKAYMSPKALYNIKKADILVGSRRLLKLFPGVDADKVVLEKNYSVLAQKIAEWSCSKQVVVLVSGDPCFFSYTRMLVKKMGRERCTIIPGISSIQLAFAAAGESWDDACFISLHGRNDNYEQLIKKVREYNKVGILTDHKNTPAVIARHLLKNGIQKRQMFICKNLSLPDEFVSETDLASATQAPTRGATVVIIKNMNHETR